MDFTYVIIVILIVILITFVLTKTFFYTSHYSKEAITLLTQIFGEQDFSHNGDIFQLQEKLHIKFHPQNDYDNSIQNIMEVTKHKIDVIYKQNMSKNKPYDETTSLHILTNEILDYSIKKNINLKGAIRLLFLTLNNKTLETILDEQKQEKEFISLFYELVPNFVSKYNKKLAE